MNIFQLNLKPELENFSTDTNVGFFKNGIFKKVKTPLGEFTYKAFELPDNLGLDLDGEFSFVRDESIPKIPYTIFENVLNFYKEIFNEIKSEVYSLVIWDKKKQDFFIYVPKQVVAGASVKYERDPEIFSNPDYILYWESHSHNVMPAFFSGTDVNDEVAGRYFGVLGKINNEIPELALKIAFNKDFKYLEYDDLFDDEMDKLHEDSDYSIDYKTVRKLITENSYTSPVNSYKGYNDNITYHKDLYPNRYRNIIVTNLFKNTIFENKTEDDNIINFVYDFQNLFSKKYNNNINLNIINLYQSLTSLILSNVQHENTLEQFVNLIYDAVDDSILFESMCIEGLLDED